MGEPSLDRSAELAHLPPASPPRNHGHTTAAWVTVTVVVVGALVIGLAMILSISWLLWAGVVVTVVGLVVGRVLAMLGFGQPRPEPRTRTDQAEMPGPDPSSSQGAA